MQPVDFQRRAPALYLAGIRRRWQSESTLPYITLDRRSANLDRLARSGWSRGLIRIAAIWRPLVLPAAMQPPILPWGSTNQLLQPTSIPLSKRGNVGQV